MAKGTAKKTSAEEPGKSYQTLRKDLMKQLKGVDASILVQVVQLGKMPGPDFFSDWPDSYNRDTWYKTWGKAEVVDPADLRGVVVQPEAASEMARGTAKQRDPKPRSSSQ